MIGHLLHLTLTHRLLGLLRLEGLLLLLLLRIVLLSRVAVERERLRGCATTRRRHHAHSISERSLSR
jgi:hypothetical protein